MKLAPVTDPSFSPYGEVLNLPTGAIVSYLQSKSQMPKEGNLYVRKDEEMASLEGISEIRERVYGLGDIEVGYCNGFNSLLNCMEYHACPEVDVAGDDLVLLLGLQSDIKEGVLNSKDLKAFILRKGEAVILRPYTLHFSPCKLSEKGFRCAIILSNKTNMDLETQPEDKKLWKVNKWLLAHKESKQAAMGAHVGIVGENIAVDF